MTAPIRLYSAKDLSAMLGITKQAVHDAERKGKIQTPKYIVGTTKAWTITQVREIKEGRK